MESNKLLRKLESKMKKFHFLYMELLLEQKCSKTAMLTTKGFKDVLQIGRQTRPKLYDFQARNTKPLVDRNIRIELDERVDVTGNIIKDINENEVKTIAEKIKAENI